MTQSRQGGEWMERAVWLRPRRPDVSHYQVHHPPRSCLLVSIATAFTPTRDLTDMEQPLRGDSMLQKQILPRAGMSGERRIDVVASLAVYFPCLHPIEVAKRSVGEFKSTPKVAACAKRCCLQGLISFSHTSCVHSYHVLSESTTCSLSFL